MNEQQQRQTSSYVSVREYLMTRTGWVNQTEITQVTGVSGKDMRVLCQMYPASFVSSVDGYKLVRYATKGEIQHCVTMLIGRSAKMLARASALSGHLAR